MQRRNEIEIISYQDTYAADLHEMVRSHIRQVPPFIEIQYDEFVSILHNPNHMTDQWYGAEEHSMKTFIGLKDGEMFAAAQISFPIASNQQQSSMDENEADLLWIFGDSQHIDDLQEFYRHLTTIVSEHDCKSIHISRNPFGAGWAGIPSCWPHLVETVQVGSSIEEELWECYWSEGTITQRELPEGYRAEFINLIHELQLHYDFHADDQIVGEIDVWIPSTLARSLTEAGIAAVEWIHVSEAYRGQGLGHALLSHMYDHCLEFGVARFILWTDSMEMKRLALKSGFIEGPVFHWITTRI